MALEPFHKRTKVADPPMMQADAPVTPKRDVQPASQKGPESAEPTGEKRPEKERKCCFCKKVQVMPPVTRCKPCNTLYNRVQKAKNSIGAASVEAWDKLEKYRKVEFMMTARHWSGHHLRGQLRLFLERDIKSHVSNALCHILEDADHLTHICREADTKLKSIRKYTRREKGKRDAEERIPPFKKQKAYPKAKQVAAEAEVTNTIAKTESKRLDRWVGYVKTLQKVLERRDADIKDLGKYVPPVTNDTLKDAQNIVNAMQAHCDAINESGECPDFIGFWASMHNFRNRFLVKAAALDRQVRGANIASGKRKGYHLKLRPLWGNLQNKDRHRRGCAVRGQTGCAKGAEPVKVSGVGVTPEIDEI